MRRCTIGSLAVIVMLSACGDRGQPPNAVGAAVDTSAAVTTTAATSRTTAIVSPTGRLRVTQHQMSCCYTEGQLSFLIVRDDKGDEVVHREFQTIDSIMPIIDLELAAGSYEIESYQRPCDGNCGLLDPPTDKCTLQIGLAEGSNLFFTAAFEPTKGCTITPTDGALQSPVPDQFALREPYKNCGLDLSLAAPGGSGGQERSCFADANAAAQTAELSAYEAGAVPDTPDFFVYRTNTDRTVDVFLPNLDRVTDGPWRSYRCAGLQPDPVRGFTVNDCTDPVEVGDAPPSTTTG